MVGIRGDIKAVIEDKKSKYEIPWINYYILLLFLVIIQKEVISALRRYLNQRRVISSPKENISLLTVSTKIYRVLGLFYASKVYLFYLNFIGQIYPTSTTQECSF